MKVEWILNTGMVGCTRTDEIEVDDDLTDDEIEEEVRSAVMERLEWSWEKKA